MRLEKLLFPHTSWASDSIKLPTKSNWFPGNEIADRPPSNNKLSRQAKTEQNPGQERACIEMLAKSLLLEQITQKTHVICTDKEPISRSFTRYLCARKSSVAKNKPMFNAPLFSLSRRLRLNIEKLKRVETTKTIKCKVCLSTKTPKTSISCVKKT